MGGMTFPFPAQNDPSSVSSAATGAQAKVTSPSDDIMQKVMQQILMPQEGVGGAIENRPQVMFPAPIHPKQLPMTGPTGNVQATTAAGQHRNDFNNLIHSTGNLVKTAINAKHEKDDRDLTADLALIQAAASNPNDPHNQAIIQALSQDPKRVKRLQKAIGYNPFSGEPPSPEQQTLMKFGAQSQAKKIQEAITQRLGPQAAQVQPVPNAVPGQNTPQSIPNAIPGINQMIPAGSAMSNLMSRMPNTAQLTPAVQLQAQLIKAGVLPTADTSLQSMTTLLKEIMTDDAKYAEMQNKLQRTDKVLAGRMAEIHERGKFLLDQEKMRQEGAGERSKVRAGATVQSAKIRSDAVKYAADARAKSIKERQGLTKQHSLLKSEVDQIDKDIKNLDVQIARSKGDEQKSLIREQQMKKELKSAKEALMDTLDRQGQLIDQDLKQSPTSILNEPDQSQDELLKDMDKEDQIF